MLLLLMLLLKVTKVITGDQKMPKMGQNSLISSLFCPKGKKSLSQSPSQELEVGLRSRPYLLVLIIMTKKESDNFSGNVVFGYDRR